MVGLAGAAAASPRLRCCRAARRAAAAAAAAAASASARSRRSCARRNSHSRPANTARAIGAMIAYGATGARATATVRSVKGARKTHCSWWTPAPRLFRNVRDVTSARVMLLPSPLLPHAAACPAKTGVKFDSDATVCAQRRVCEGSAQRIARRAKPTWRKARRINNREPTSRSSSRSLQAQGGAIETRRSPAPARTLAPRWLASAAPANRGRRACRTPAMRGA